jgi:hypothetical protein
MLTTTLQIGSKSRRPPSIAQQPRTSNSLVGGNCPVLLKAQLALPYGGRQHARLEPKYTQLTDRGRLPGILYRGTSPCLRDVHQISHAAHQ